jgi:hypothetical protein
MSGKPHSSESKHGFSAQRLLKLDHRSPSFLNCSSSSLNAPIDRAFVSRFPNGEVFGESA